jgi:hypothetical protein
VTRPDRRPIGALDKPETFSFLFSFLHGPGSALRPIGAEASVSSYLNLETYPDSLSPNDTRPIPSP